MPSPITPREREVFALAAQGLTHKEIGERLGITARTAKAHTESLRRKLGVKNKRGLITYAIERLVEE